MTTPQKGREVSSEETLKFDQDKLPMGLLPWSALEEVAKVLQFGAEKYHRYNWMKGTLWSRVYDAALRHLTAWIEGEPNDSESNLSHLAHCSCCLLFLLTYEKFGIGEDDRHGIKLTTKHKEEKK